MPDDLHQRDLVLWSADQAEKLRRLSSGEQANDIDWPNLVIEVADLGISETKAVRKLLLRALERLLRVIAFPAAPDHRSWLHEANVFLRDARLDWTPGMDRLIDLPELYALACETVRDLSCREGPAADLPACCPVGLRDLLPAEKHAFARADGLIKSFQAA